MADRALPLSLPQGVGRAAIGFVLALTLGPLVLVAWRADGLSGFGPADWAALRFTVSQAVVSAGLSVLLAVPVARALSRRSFPGRRALITLLGAPFLLPVIVAIFGLLTVFGASGWISALLGWVGIGPISIYGFHGVVLAHVFFNLPLAVRMVLQGWAAIPAERFRLAASLGAPVGLVLERPMLRTVLPGAFLVIFLICLTSFAVALILGGGPRATTVELAIYQALRFEFDLGRAAALSAVQVGLCLAAVGLSLLVARPDGMGAGLDRVVRRWDGAAPLDALAICAAALFLLAPLLAVFLRGAPGLADLPDGTGAAALRSVLVALTASGLSTALAVALAFHRKAEVWAMLPLSSSALVVGTGAFLALYRFTNPSDLALPVLALTNALFAVPFAYRVLRPEVLRIEARHGPLAASLGLTGWAKARIVTLPQMRPALGFAAGLSAALSMGDLGVITLFAAPGEGTLPWLMAQLMGSYRTEAAAGVGLLLLGASLALFWVFDRGGRLNAPA